ncbi:MAG TPA: CapA family protein [Streptosporangiaceae bacterium]|nr:CapA family protein [Streptosporangiaceae bacterium]
MAQRWSSSIRTRGDEYAAQPSSFQLRLARGLTRSPDITAIVGQHAHVVQPIRIINGKPVVFGEGKRTVAVVGRSPRIQPIPAELP